MESLTREEFMELKKMLDDLKNIDEIIKIQNETSADIEDCIKKMSQNYRICTEVEIKPIVEVKKEAKKTSEIFCEMFIKNPKDFSEVIEIGKYTNNGIATEKDAKKCYKENVKNDKFKSLMVKMISNRI